MGCGACFQITHNIDFFRNVEDAKIIPEVFHFRAGVGYRGLKRKLDLDSILK